MTLTTAGKRNVLNPRNADPRIVLLTLEHDDLDFAHRYTNNFEDIESGGETFTAFPFMVTFPTDDDGVPRGTIRVSNVTRELWDLIGTVTTPPKITITFVLASDPDTTERTFALLEVRRIVATMLSLEAEYSHENYAAESYPARRLTPKVFSWINRQG